MEGGDGVCDSSKSLSYAERKDSRSHAERERTKDCTENDRGETCLRQFHTNTVKRSLSFSSSALNVTEQTMFSKRSSLQRNLKTKTPSCSKVCESKTLSGSKVSVAPVVLRKLKSFSSEVLDRPCGDMLDFEDSVDCRSSNGTAKRFQSMFDFNDSVALDCESSKRIAKGSSNFQSPSTSQYINHELGGSELSRNHSHELRSDLSRKLSLPVIHINSSPLLHNNERDFNTEVIGRRLKTEEEKQPSSGSIPSLLNYPALCPRSSCGEQNGNRGRSVSLPLLEDDDDDVGDECEREEKSNCENCFSERSSSLPLLDTNGNYDEDEVIGTRECDTNCVNTERSSSLPLLDCGSVGDDHSEENMSCREQNVNRNKQNVNHIEPNGSHIEPNVSHTKQNGNHIEYNVSHNEPNVNHSKQNVNNSEQNMSHGEQNANSSPSLSVDSHSKHSEDKDKESIADIRNTLQIPSTVFERRFSSELLNEISSELSSRGFFHLGRPNNVSVPARPYSVPHFSAQYDFGSMSSSRSMPSSSGSMTSAVSSSGSMASSTISSSGSMASSTISSSGSKASSSGSMPSSSVSSSGNVPLTISSSESISSSSASSFGRMPSTISSSGSMPSSASSSSESKPSAAVSAPSLDDSKTKKNSSSSRNTPSGVFASSSFVNRSSSSVSRSGSKYNKSPSSSKHDETKLTSDPHFAKRSDIVASAEKPLFRDSLSLESECSKPGVVASTDKPVFRDSLFLESQSSNTGSVDDVDDDSFDSSDCSVYKRQRRKMLRHNQNSPGEKLCHTWGPRYFENKMFKRVLSSEGLKFSSNPDVSKRKDLLNFLKPQFRRYYSEDIQTQTLSESLFEDVDDCETPVNVYSRDSKDKDHDNASVDDSDDIRASLDDVVSVESLDSYRDSGYFTARPESTEIPSSLFRDSCFAQLNSSDSSSWSQFSDTYSDDASDISDDDSQNTSDDYDTDEFSKSADVSYAELRRFRMRKKTVVGDEDPPGQCRCSSCQGVPLTPRVLFDETDTPSSFSYTDGDVANTPSFSYTDGDVANTPTATEVVHNGTDTSSSFSYTEVAGSHTAITAIDEDGLISEMAATLEDAESFDYMRPARFPVEGDVNLSQKSNGDPQSVVQTSSSSSANWSLRKSTTELGSVLQTSSLSENQSFRKSQPRETHSVSQTCSSSSSTRAVEQSSSSSPSNTTQTSSEKSKTLVTSSPNKLYQKRFSIGRSKSFDQASSALHSRKKPASCENGTQRSKCLAQRNKGLVEADRRSSLRNGLKLGEWEAALTLNNERESSERENSEREDCQRENCQRGNCQRGNCQRGNCQRENNDREINEGENNERERIETENSQIENNEAENSEQKDIRLGAKPASKHHSRNRHHHYHQHHHHINHHYTTHHHQQHTHQHSRFRSKHYTKRNTLERLWMKQLWDSAINKGSFLSQLRVNQDDLEAEMTLGIQEEEEEVQRQLLQKTTAPSSSSSKTHLRSNVVHEIITAEAEYVKHLRDVIEGYLKQARKRPEMFPVEKVTVIFSNIEVIYDFATKLLADLQTKVNHDHPHITEFGQCFLKKAHEFEIYSEYCNNHPAACEELRELYRVKKYRHFFEACRLLQEMSEIPLEGFLLTPVQKICKYHLQLAELLKYTPQDHPDHPHVHQAVDAMKRIAKLVNERKRKMESIETLAEWQMLVDDWEGPDILDDSSELIYSGELNKINANGWSQERFFFLFDHQLVYCKKDLLKRNSFCYKGRVNMDHSIIISLPDGRDSQYNVMVRNGFKLHDQQRDKWFLMVAKTAQTKQRWLKAFSDERRRVHDDMVNNFNIPAHLKQAIVTSLKQKFNTTKSKGKRKVSRGGSMRSSTKTSSWVATNATLPRQLLKSNSTPAQSNRIFNFLLGNKKK